MHPQLFFPHLPMPTALARDFLFTITSSHGTITANPLTGEVIKIERDNPEDPETLPNVTRIDLVEWRRAYPNEEPGGMSVDILDVAYWCQIDDDHEVYEPAVEEWRAEFRKLGKSGTPTSPAPFIGSWDGQWGQDKPHHQYRRKELKEAALRACYTPALHHKAPLYIQMLGRSVRLKRRRFPWGVVILILIAAYACYRIWR